jgi:hypothetical protein
MVAKTRSASLSQGFAPQTSKARAESVRLNRAVSTAVQFENPFSTRAIRVKKAGDWRTNSTVMSVDVAIPTNPMFADET